MLTTQPPKKTLASNSRSKLGFFLNIHLTSYNIFSGLNLKHTTPFTIALHTYLDAFVLFLFS